MKFQISQICFKFSILLIAALFLPQTVFCQTEKLGIVNYTPPKGWSKTPKENVIGFNEINQKTGGFCIITLYGATSGTGNPANDFTREWNNLVITTFKAEANPKTETQTENGWTMTAGAAGVEIEGSKALAFLTVFTSGGTTVSVLGVFNEQSYLANFEAFVGSIEMDKTTTVPTVIGNNPNTNQSNSAPGKFGSMSYDKPAGWSEQKFADGVVFKPLDLPASENLAIQIMSPLNASGTLEQALAQSYAEATKMYNATMAYPNYASSTTIRDRKSFNGWEYVRGTGGILVQDGTQFGTGAGLEVFVIRVNNRFERIAILESRTICKPYLIRHGASDRKSYRSAIENFLFSIQFSDFNEPALKSGSTKGSGIVGIWRGIITGTGFEAASGLSVETFSAIFLTNGQVFFGRVFPSAGLDGVNTRILAEVNQHDWKTYTYSNGRGNLNMGFGDFPFRIEGNNLIITKNQTDWKFYKLNDVDGATFNGTYAMSAVNGIIPTITFTSDGRFTDNGALKVLYHEYFDCLNPAATPGSGTYEVKDYSITFTYSDGRQIKLAFLGTDYTKGNASPATLRMSFNEDKLIKQ